MEIESKTVVKSLKYSRLSAQRINKILLYFCEDITAVTTAKLTGVNRKTVDRYYNEIWKKILKCRCGRRRKLAEGSRRTSHISGRGAFAEKGDAERLGNAVFGFLKRGGKVFAQMVKYCSKGELMPIIQGKLLEKSPFTLMAGLLMTA